MEAGRGRRVSCGRCALVLDVPRETQTIRCWRCRSITSVRPAAEPFRRVHEPVLYAAEWLKGLYTNVSSSAINYVATTSMNNNKPPAPVPAPPPPAVMNYNGCYYGPPPPPPPPPLLLSAPNSYPWVGAGRKRALLCAVSYKSRPYELKGTINDVNCMRFLLVEKFKFPNDSILVLTEDEQRPERIPTKRNIQMALQWLIRGCQPGDSLVFHYSGHGSQQPNFSGDEVDGYDETICPLDYQTEGMILDDEINATIVRPLPSGATLHAIIDACHSGTVLDLPFLCKINRDGSCWWQNHSPPSGAYKGTSGGLAICFSACDDNQTSADTTAFSSSNVMQGAMTFSFIRAVDNTLGLTYGQLLNAMRAAIRDVDTGGFFNGPISSLIRKVFRNRLPQETQLSSSEEFDIYMKRFVL
ncbi:hypothetical protein NE237_030508 [Protea cynaroides]|uniref:Peptidase C14 caspase domain-containing protein n=1 Tax=Protea cynaroides TaxID=273540 RepID=A0A9Q0GT66_9MAGN|nr:hypothetical protein NE237_030508 [Protea cynaroides]